MPRVENRGPNVDAWYAAANGDGTSTHDVCRVCAAKLDTNPHAFDAKLTPYQSGEPQGTEGWGGDVEHPPYDEQEPAYRCHACGKRLTDRDE